MTKFHDEFFSKGSSKHDDLILWCNSEEGKKRISNEIKKQFPNKFLEKGGIASRNTEQFGTVDFIIEKIETEIFSETEVLCKSGSFILGYADMIFHLNETYYTVHDIDCEGRQWYEDGKISEAPSQIGWQTNVHVVIEVKPELKEIGSVLRQIKTYMDVLRIQHGVLVTSSILPQSKIDLLKSESVFVISVTEPDFDEDFDEENGIKQNLLRK